MCGIGGFIGKSQNPELSYKIMTSVFANLEVRGEDASGYWGTDHDTNQIVFHKEAKKSSEFVKTKHWTQLSTCNLDALIIHARGTSFGVGHAKDNKNNHPFVTENKETALVHNGRVPDFIYQKLKENYQLESSCDSEILLRIFEAAQHKDDYSDFNLTELETIDNQIKSRLSGIRDIWSQVTFGAMAVIIGEKLPDDHKRLWLFRNELRDLWLIDLRDTLGQIFFCSTPEIWVKAVQEVNFVDTAKLVELPPEEVWSFTISKKDSIINNKNLRKFSISTESVDLSNYHIPVESNKNKEETETEEYDFLVAEDIISKADRMIDLLELIKSEIVSGTIDVEDYNKATTSMDVAAVNLGKTLKLII